MKRLHDQHLHSRYSRDSKNDVEEYYQLNNNLGCKYFISTEHIEFDSVYNHQDWTVDYEGLKAELKQLQQKYPYVTPLLGVEIGYRRDKLQNMEDFLKTQDFDLINLSIHDNGVQDYYLKQDYLELGISQMLEIYFNNAIDGVKTFKDYDVLSHIDYGFKTAKMLDSKLQIKQYEKYLKEIFKQVVEDDKVLEINFKVQETINDQQHLRDLLQMYREVGGTKLTFSSDAHFLSQLQEYYDKQNEYIQIFKDMGFKELYYFVKRQPHKYMI